jgi:hypothetical protein
MGEDLEARLAEAATRRHRFQAASARAHELAALIPQLQREIERLQDTQADEEWDVEKLEGWSFVRILAALAGSRDDRLARERAEAEAAAYRVAEARARLDVLAQEQAAATAEIAQLASAQSDYDALLVAKEELLAASTDPRGRRLFDLAAERGQLTGLVRELDEAIVAANQAAQALDVLGQTLHSAFRRSTYGRRGGGVLGSMIKYDHLDHAAFEAADADRRLAVLRTELADVEKATRLQPLQIGGLTRFLDVWFDNPFTHWHVADRINAARQNVAVCEREVATLRFRLRQRADDARARLDVLDRDRQALLTA